MMNPANPESLPAIFAGSSLLPVTLTESPRNSSATAVHVPVVNWSPPEVIQVEHRMSSLFRRYIGPFIVDVERAKTVKT